MRRFLLITLMLAVCLADASRVVAATVAGDAVLDQARKLIAGRDHARAAEVLEEALPTMAASDRPAVIDLLRQSYLALIASAEAAGKTAEAAEYRDNLAILGPPASGGSPSRDDASAGDATSAPDAPSAPLGASPDESPQFRPEPLPLPRSSNQPERDILPEPAPLPDPGEMLPLESPALGQPANAIAAPRTAGPQGSVKSGGAAVSKSNQGVKPHDLLSPSLPTNTPQPSVGQERSIPVQDQSPGGDLDQADQLFTDKNYAEAGKLYTNLAAQNRLPAERKECWAYCRWVAVVAKVNEHPTTDQEWDAIEDELRSVKKLVPDHWLNGYLLSRVAEDRKKAKSKSPRSRLVVRGSSPEEETSPRRPGLLGRFSKANAATPPAAPASRGEETLGLPSGEDSLESQKPLAEPPANRAVGTPRPGGQGREASSGTPLSWQIQETANFRIFHTDPVLAAQAAQAAESVRARQSKRWGSAANRSPWTPRCDIYLYPTPTDFAQMTGQAETSPGFSTMGVSDHQIISRRVNLRADHPQLITAILPHEVTHVVLADLFTQQQIPRWADEGMAVLAEPLSEQIHRAADLAEPLREDRLFKLSELMSIDYPNADAWGLYYAQSVSLTQFLVQLGTPEQFLTFVRSAQRQGSEQSLREVYHINGFEDLEGRWQEFARRQVGEMTASSTRDTAVDQTAVR